MRPPLRHTIMRLVLRSLLFVSIGLVALNGMCQSQTSAGPTGSRIVDFARDIAPLLQDKCLSCHQGEKAKNGFVVSDSELVLGFIERGNASESALWTDHLSQPPKSQDGDSLVMPPDGPLEPAELALLKLWIDEGAVWPVGATVGVHRTDPSPEALKVSLPMSTKIYRAIGYFHPAMIHFPIALFFVSGCCAFLSYFLGPKCSSTAFQCLVVAVLTSVVTVVMGWSFADTQGYPTWWKMLPVNPTHADENFFYHRWGGTSLPVLGLLVVLIGLLARRFKSVQLNHLWRVGTILLAGLVMLVGHQGGELKYGDIFDKAWEQLRK